MKPLQVRVYDEQDNITWQGLFADLCDANPDMGEDWTSVGSEIRKHGRCWIGGGAGPLLYVAAFGRE
jgi:hypothetical protein